jgi:hypothetical protein
MMPSLCISRSRIKWPYSSTMIRYSISWSRRKHSYRIISGLIFKSLWISTKGIRLKCMMYLGKWSARQKRTGILSHRISEERRYLFLEDIGDLLKQSQFWPRELCCHIIYSLLARCLWETAALLNFTSPKTSLKTYLVSQITASTLDLERWISG